MPSFRSLAELIASCGVDRRGPEAQRLEAYRQLLTKWNARVNLTASTGWQSLEGFFWEALWATRFYAGGRMRHLDIGSGAGFPAIPMRILLPEMSLILVEPRARRAAFLETVAAELGLAGTEVYCGRVEDWLHGAAAAPPDVISWKGMKLGTEAFERLRGIGNPDTRLWLFHGAELPFADPRAAQERLRALRREDFPGRQGWHLSVFAFREECFT